MNGSSVVSGCQLKSNVDTSTFSGITQLVMLGLTVDTIYESGEVAIPLKDRVFGRYLADDVKTSDGKVIMKDGDYISHDEIETIEKENITSVRIKSPITCGCINGICAKAYGRDLAKGVPVNTGEAVGIIAAQSIGEPGTQLTIHAKWAAIENQRIVIKDFLRDRFSLRWQELLADDVEAEVQIGLASI